MLEERFWWVGIGYAAGLFLSQAAIAQPIVPAADGTNTQVTVDGAQFNIDGGQRSGDGANLFHSFQEFGLSAEQTANFLAQPEIQNILGRVRGGNASFIDGLLQVTGGNTNLYLINPSGILFGPNARLNLPANFTAATASGVGFGNGWFDLTTTDYADLVGAPSQLGFDSATLGNLVNTGQLAVAEGQTLTLMGGTVVNTGTLSAPGGTILVSAIAAPAGGSAIVRLSPVDGILSLDVQAERLAPDANLPEALSLPQLITGGAAVGNATGLSVNEAGVAVLSGSGVRLSDEAGTVIVSGDLTVAGATGGLVQVTGDRVGLVSAAIDASGAQAGGTALIGGDFQGQGGLPTAEHTYVSRDSRIDVSSRNAGNAGRAIVWADDTTRFFGTVDAQGGPLAGDGGFVEISGANQLTFDGTVRLDAANGTSGSLLLDPQEILIIDDTNFDPVTGDLLRSFIDLNGNLVSEPVEFLGFEQDANGNDIITAPIFLKVTDLVDDQLSDGAIFATDGAPNDIFYISEAALEALNGNVTLEATAQIRFVTLADKRLTFPAGPGDTITFRTTAPLPNVVDSSIVIQSSVIQSPIGDQQTIETNGGDLVFNVANFITQVGVSGLILRSQGGDITINSGRDIGGLALIDTSSNIRSGGDVTLFADNSIGFPLIERINTSSTSTIVGDNHGGNIDAQTNPATPAVGLPVEFIRIQFADTSSTTGDAGNIFYRSALTEGDTNFEASAPNGRAGDITLEATGQGPYLPVVLDLSSIRALGNAALAANDPNQGGNLTIIADEINFLQQSDDFVPRVFQLSGEASFAPQSANQDIRIGGAGAIGPGFAPDDLTLDASGNGVPGTDDSPTTLHLSTFELSIFSVANNQGSLNQADAVRISTTGSGKIAFAPTLQDQRLTINTILEGGAGSVIFGPDRATEYTILGAGEGIIGGFENDTNGDGILDAYLRFANVGTIRAGGADDALVFLNNNATFAGNFDGGGGINVLDFSGNPNFDPALAPGGVNGYTDNLTVDLASGVVQRASGTPIVTGTVSGIQGVIGGSGDDTIQGDANANRLGGGGGNDIIDGRGGEDILEVERDASFELQAGATPVDIVLRIDNGNDGTFDETDQISNIEIARVLGGPSDNTFTVDANTLNTTTAFSGDGTLQLVLLDGADGGDTYTLGADGVGTGSIIVGDTGTTGTDTLTVTGSNGDDTFAVFGANSPNPGGFDPNPATGLVLPADATLLTRLDQSLSGFSAGEISDLERLNILDTQQVDQFGNATPLDLPAFRVSLVNLNSETVAFSGIEDSQLDGRDGSDTYSPTLQARTNDSLLNLTITDTGTVGNDRLEVDGNQFANQFNITLAANPASLSGLTVLTPILGVGAETVNFAGLEAVTLDGQADLPFQIGDTYTVALGSPSGITLNIADSGAGIDTLLVNGTSGADTFAVNAGSVVLTSTSDQVTYSGIEALGLDAGAGDDQIAITGTPNLDFGIDIDAGVDGGDIIATANITVAGTQAPTGTPAIAPGIWLQTSNGTIDTSGVTLSTAPATGAGDPITLIASDGITTGDLNTSGTSTGGAVTLNSSNGSVNTAGGTVTTTATAGPGGAVTIQAQQGITTSDITTSGTTQSGAVSLTTSMGDIDTSGGTIDTTGNSRGGAVTVQANGALTMGAVTTASANGRGADIALAAAGDITTGDLASNGRTSAGNVSIDGERAVITHINAQGDDPVFGQGGDVTIAVTDQLQLTDTFVDNNGIVASISTAGNAGNGDINLVFSETVTFAVGDSAVNGTAGAIAGSASNVVENTTITGNFEQGNIRVLVLIDPPGIGTPPVIMPPTVVPPVVVAPPTAELELTTDFQTLIEDPVQQTPLPVVCLPESNLEAETGIELSEESQPQSAYCKSRDQ